jgi:hypothetical protein
MLKTLTELAVDTIFAGLAIKVTVASDLEALNVVWLECLRW